jgi:2-(1,2-epoxy-1,2-dihydrophenyl)acetyl-CoA isomerase
VDAALAAGFETAVGTALADRSVGAILLSGAGRSFMAGGDITSMGPREGRAAAIVDLIEPVHRALKLLAASPVVTLAALQGPIAGAGMSLALGTDLAIAGEGARFSMAYVRLGTTPDTGGTWALARLVGHRRAMEIALLNPVLTAGEALALGLVNRVVPDPDLAAEAKALARRLAAGPREAQARTKALLRRAPDTSLADQLDAERDAFLDCAADPDFDEGLAAFRERRAPKFRSRRSGGAPTTRR